MNRIRRQILLPLLATVFAIAAPAAQADDSNLDPTFGSGGVVGTSLPGDEAFDALAVQPDGKFVVAGTTPAGGSNGNFLVARYLADGTPDPSFGDAGVVTTAVGSANDRVYGITLQPDGKILVSGSAHTTSGGINFAVVRYLANGNRDNSFSSDGRKTVAVAPGHDPDQALDAILVAGGKIVLAGETTTGTSTQAASVRLTPGGELDTTYCGSGKCVLAMPGNFDARSAVAGPGNTVVVAGRYRPVPDSRLASIVRITPTGALDPGFGSNGVKSSLVGPGEQVLTDVAVAAGGSVFATGYADAHLPGHPDGSDRQFTLVKLTPDGKTDQGFGGGDGHVETQLGAPGAEEYAQGVAIQPDGRVLVTGYATGFPVTALALVRYDAAGTLDPSFSGDGVKTVVVGGFTSGNVVASAPGGRIVVGGELAGPVDADSGLFVFGNPPVAPNPGQPGQPNPDPGQPAPDPGGTTPGGNDPLPPAGDLTPPSLTKVSLSAHVFRTKGAPKSKARRPLGTKLLFTVSEPARVTLTVDRRKGTKLVRLGKIRLDAHAGRNKRRIKGRVGSKLLRSGRYVGRLRAADSAGNRSVERRVSFRVVA